MKTLRANFFWALWQSPRKCYESLIEIFISFSGYFKVFWENFEPKILLYLDWGLITSYRCSRLFHCFTGFCDYCSIDTKWINLLIIVYDIVRNLLQFLRVFSFLFQLSSVSVFSLKLSSHFKDFNLHRFILPISYPLPSQTIFFFYLGFLSGTFTNH